MHLGLVLETNDPERVWNPFRLANTALDVDYRVEVFLFGDGVEEPDSEHEKITLHGVMRKYTRTEANSLPVGRVLTPATSNRTFFDLVRR
ncbi:hypothetical protein [Natrinema sp. 1APR25-10V2]|uniref:hypothetical protein n=1 Tax=Natrinema sp. 1APR25-10V2 TaxID=2951081 RepID=UPI002875039E|nr:hypothetical protein [Natrinema sp. 1APR25-10V2]MDS0477174.1 hypothetical protein [Natrinema sp. 1APR25-10V2]